ncbi:hypothetical protein [Kitasatospora sp. NPDC051914]|uniref:hypothetical protein n=1 Tax=Kitasatospora sp. NPDC051914 TaxID=3154945 RepID=UPI00343C106E
MDAPSRRPAPPGHVLPRRAVLLGLAGALAGACTSRAGTVAGPGTPGSPSASPSSAPSSPSAAGLPATTPWQPGPGENHPEVKLRAVELIETIGAWPPGEQGTDAARKRVAALGLDPSLVEQAGPLLGPGAAAALQIVNAQWGGYQPDSASVMVVCRQWTTAAAGGTTVDVRLVRAQPRWNVTALHPAEPVPPAARISDAAQRVLAEPRIRLPFAAIADVRGGAVHDSVLEAMLALAAKYTFAVTVLRSGHPVNVFETSRTSDHTRGRAVDVWQIDDHAVVDPATPHALVDGFMRDAAALGAYNIGGPRQLGGGTAPRQYFTDDAHHDHVHLGFPT